MMMTLQQLRDIEDNKHIDSFIESDDSFNDWEREVILNTSQPITKC